MQRYKLTLEYDGTKFCGFQKQNDQVTVQSTLEEAIKKIDQNSSDIVCAGRTDSGVHAVNQIVHFDSVKMLPSHKMRDAINYHLHTFAISIKKVELVDFNFHARYSAKQRWYSYKIIEQWNKPTFNNNLYWWLKPYKVLDVDLMQKASKHLLGTHDFSTFRSKGCGANSPIRTIDEISIIKDNEFILINIKAPSFLYHQVRNIVGALVLVGHKKWTVDYLKQALNSADSSLRIKVAPPYGLYFTNVVY